MMSGTRSRWPALDTSVEQVLAVYEARQADEDRLLATLEGAEIDRRRDELLISVGRAAGVLLNLLVRESHARSILELGTAFGYSTIWLADAARATGGQVVTVDTSAVKQQHAIACLSRAGLLSRVKVHCGDALAFLASTPDTFDFALIDVWKDGYIACVDAVLTRLAPVATIVADNMLEPQGVRFAASRYQAHVQKISELQTLVLPVGNGVAISRYRSRGTH